MRSVKGLCAATCTLLVAGCTSLGSDSVARDRFEYSAALSDSWKRQTLLNIVKLRYLDPPIFVDVGQIVAGYTLESALSAGGAISSPGAVQGDTLSLGGSVKYTDRPTITYTPLTGDRFVRGLMTPLPPQSIFFTIQSGWPADAVLLATVSAINGLKNQEVTHGSQAAPDPRFLRAIRLLREIQLSGAVGMRVLVDEEAQETSILTFRTEGIPPEVVERVTELRGLLGLDPDAQEFRLVFGGVAQNSLEVAVLPRSILSLMQTMAAQIDVPAADLAETRATPGWESFAETDPAARIVHIHSSAEEPDPSTSFVTIRYRGSWFTIDDRDLRSKRAFAFMLLLFTLADTGERQGLPLVTIPAQ